MQISRRSPPTKLDTAPKGTVCVVTEMIPSPELEGSDLLIKTRKLNYIQTSFNEENPMWELIHE